MTRTIFILGFLVGAVGALAQDSNSWRPSAIDGLTVFHWLQMAN